MMYLWQNPQWPNFTWNKSKLLNPLLELNSNQGILEGPMRVISGYGKNETVHFEAPPANILQSQMTLFFEWFNGYYRMDFVVHWMHESGSFICT